MSGTASRLSWSLTCARTLACLPPIHSNQHHTDQAQHPACWLRHDCSSDIEPSAARGEVERIAEKSKAPLLGAVRGLLGGERIHVAQDVARVQRAQRLRERELVDGELGNGIVSIVLEGLRTD